MSKWTILVSRYKGSTWDVPVECDDDLTSEERKKIENLGYYGKPVKPEHATALENDQPYKRSKPYAIAYHGVDGDETHEFNTLDEAKTFIVERIQWCQSDTCVGSDYAKYYLDGFKLSDIGVDWKKYQP
jgi:hypothetical protein